MKKSKLCLLSAAYSLLSFHLSPIQAAPENCPKEAIHCVYNTADSGPKWVKAVMLPKNITMVVCMNKDTVLYLEKDDVKMDNLKPGAVLNWQLSQCFDESCLQAQPLGRDQFTLLVKDKHYTADPASYGFALDPNYGTPCSFPLKKIMLNP